MTATTAHDTRRAQLPPTRDKSRLDGLARQAMTIGLLSRLLEANSPSLAVAVEFGRRQGDVLCNSLRNRGIDDVIDVLMRNN